MGTTACFVTGSVIFLRNAQLGARISRHVGAGRRKLARYAVPVWRSCSSTSQSPPQNPPPSDDEALQKLNAFDEYLNQLEYVEEGKALTAQERRRVALDREKEYKHKQFEEKLAVLTALPEDLFIEQVANKCPGCGCELQSKDELLPGYLPEEILSERARLLIEDRMSAQQATETQEVDSDVISREALSRKERAEADAKLATMAGISQSQISEFRDILEEEGLDLDEFQPASQDTGDSVSPLDEDVEDESDRLMTATEVIAAKKKGGPIICQRCFRLSNYGVIEPELRVESPRKLLERTSATTDTDRELKSSDQSRSSKRKVARAKRVLTPATFRQNLEKIRSKPAVIVYLVDVFDFHGTFLSGLRDMVGDRCPVIMAVNKVDLLPSDYRKDRVERWVRHESNSLGLNDLQSVHLISSTQGTGVKALLADALTVAKKRRADIYIAGAANVGKSSFINYVIENRASRGIRRTTAENVDERRKKQYKQKRNEGVLTTSVIPGTTLDVIRIPLGTTVSLYDTPGIIMSHQLTNSLNAQELRSVLPAKSVERVTLRLGEGKALFLGALARVEVVEGKPFFLTAFVSSNVKVHPGRIENAEEFTSRHVGGLLTPPYTNDRLLELGEWSSKTFTAHGEGWKRACLDIVLSGLGWVAVTGVGSVKLKICAPKGVGVFTRDALMPFEVSASGVAKYTGTNAVNVREAKKAARKRKERRFTQEDADYF